MGVENRMNHHMEDYVTLTRMLFPNHGGAAGKEYGTLNENLSCAVVSTEGFQRIGTFLGAHLSGNSRLATECNESGGKKTIPQQKHNNHSAHHRQADQERL